MDEEKIDDYQPALDAEDDYSLPLSARRERERAQTRAEQPPPLPADIAAVAADEDGEYSLPLSARREQERKPDDCHVAAGEAPRLPRYAEAPPPPPLPPPPEFRELPPDKGLSLRALTEAAMMAAISLVLALIGTYVPLLSIVGLLLYPLPMAVLVLRRGLKPGIIGVAVLFALSSFVLGLPQALLMLIQYGILGLFLGYCFRSGKKPLFTLGIASLIAAIGTLAGLMLSLYISGLPLDALVQEMEMVVDEFLAMMEASGAATGSYSLGEMRSYLITTMSGLIPAIVIVSGMMMTALCYFVAGKVLRRLRYDIPRLPRFADWRMDWRFSWGLILGLICMFAGKQLDIVWLNTLGQNILYCFAPVLIICGAAFIAWYFRFISAGYVFKIIAVLLFVMFFNSVAIFLMLLAVFDPLLDLRGRLTRARERASR